MAKSNRMTAPEPTPQDKALKRVLLVSAIDGWSVAVIASLGVLLTLIIGDWLGTGIGLLVLAAGVLELHGRRQIMRRDSDGLKQLVRAQLFLLAVILVYCTSRLGSFDADTAMASLTPDMEALLKEAGLERADILPLVRITFFATYGGVALLSLLFQGGLILYYRRKTRLVTAALTAPAQSPLA